VGLSPLLSVVMGLGGGHSAPSSAKAKNEAQGELYVSPFTVQQYSSTFGTVSVTVLF
jgi:hypothetical protein